MSTPSDDELKKAVSAKVRTSDLKELTTKQVFKYMEEKFGSDLTAKKELMRAAISEALNEIKKSSGEPTVDEKSANNAINRPLRFNAKFAAFLGGERLARPQAVKKVWDYVREKSLKPEKGGAIAFDATLQEVFGCLTATVQEVPGLVSKQVVDEEGRPVPPKEKRPRPAEGAGGVVKRQRKEKKTKSKGEQKARQYKLVALSPELAELVGAKAMPRQELTRRIWAYVKAHSLKDENDKQMVNCDGALRALFGVERVPLFKELQKLLNPHIKKLEEADQWSYGDFVEREPYVAGVAVPASEDPEAEAAADGDAAPEGGAEAEDEEPDSDSEGSAED